jgi:hypothetical protein
MKTFLFLISFVLSEAAFCGSDTIRLASKVVDVTVFSNGAQVTRIADLKAQKGKHLIIFEKLPPEIAPQSIQVEGIPGCNILTVKYQLFTSGDTKKTSGQLTIERKIDTLDLKNKVIQNKIRAFEAEEMLLTDNSILSRKDDGTTVAEIKAAADFYRIRVNEILQAKLALNKTLDANNQEIDQQYSRLNELTYESRKTNGQLQLTLDCERDIAETLKCNYSVRTAGWTPSYDFRVNDITKPLSIIYIARVFQSTGEDWKSVNIHLSGNNPSLDASAPELLPWILGQQSAVKAEPELGQSGSIKGQVHDAQTGEPIPFANIVILNSSHDQSGATTDFDGNYLIKPVAPGDYTIKVSYVGYKLVNLQSVKVYAGKITYQDFKLEQTATNLQEIQVTDYKVPAGKIDNIRRGGNVTASEIAKMAPQRETRLIETVNLVSNSLRTNITDIEYSIDIPYTIPSDGQEYNIRIKEVKVPVSYVYNAIPKLDKGVFLTAEIPDWTGLKLLSGKAAIFYQGTYTGETYIDAAQNADTLRVSLGRDRNIIVTREGNKEMNDKRIIGSNIKETVAWDITVKNNKDSKIRISIQDQIPLTDRKSIDVEKLESPGASFDERTGNIHWDLDLEPNAKKTVNFRYSVKYPKITGLEVN